MGKLERITVTLPEEMIAKLRAVVETGEYATEGEIVREVLSGWSDEQDRKEAAIAKIREMVAEAEKGPFMDGEQAMAELRSYVAARVAEEKSKRGEI